MKRFSPKLQSLGVSIILLFQANLLLDCHGFGVVSSQATTARGVTASTIHHPGLSSSDHGVTMPASRQQMKKPPASKTMVLSMSTQDEEEIESNSISTPLDRPIVAAIDFLALLGFAAVGKASHAADGSIDFLAVLSVAAPFLVSWYVTSPITGVYKPSTRNKDSTLLQEAITAAKGWIVAVPLGIALRYAIKGYPPPVPFVIVTMIATLIILAGSRVIFSIAEDFFVELVN